MSACHSKATITLALLSLGAYACPAAFAAPPAQPPGLETPAQLMQEKIGDVYARYDKDGDGYISLAEFTDLKKTSRAFQSADVNRDGRLDVKECEKGLGS
jgi:EF hand